MKLLPNWRRVLSRAWSVRLIVLAGALTGIEAILPLLGDALPIPAGSFAALSFLVVAGAFVARLIAQEGLHDE